MALVDATRLKAIENKVRDAQAARTAMDGPYDPDAERDMLDLCETVKAAAFDATRCARERDQARADVIAAVRERDALRETVEAMKRLAHDAKLYSLPDAILANVERALSLETKS